VHAAFELSQLRPVINKVFDLEQLKEAYDYSVSGDHIGKIVVRVAR
jgi:NADPH:quinone reductase-like Zn-dependent oxidoreductase